MTCPTCGSRTKVKDVRERKDVEYSIVKQALEIEAKLKLPRAEVFRLRVCEKGHEMITSEHIL